MARWFIIAGIILVFIGLILWLIPNAFNWFGKLPGDIKIEKENSRVFIPLTSMILVSVILTIVVNVVRYFLK